LVDIENDSGDIRRLFIGPAAGGLSIGEKSEIIQVITTATPLGKALLNKTLDDEFELNIGRQSQHFTVIDIR
jgi:transcription elongation GreA/GreB family factor